MKKYKLICMSFDGSFITEAHSNDVSELWKVSENLGSKWFFYPFHFVCTEKSIKEAYEPILYMEGKRIKSLQNLFKTAHENLLEQKKSLNEQDFLWELLKY